MHGLRTLSRAVVCGLPSKERKDAQFHVKGIHIYLFIKLAGNSIVPSYYEWLTKGKEKLPHFTRREDGLLLLMAGLYDSVELDGKHLVYITPPRNYDAHTGKTLWSFTIVTTDANKDFSWLHDRQPVFLSNRNALERWLDTSSQTWTPELTQMLQPYSDTSVALTW